MLKTLLVLLILPTALLAQRPTDPVNAASFVLPKVGTKIINTYYVTDSLGRLVPKTAEDADPQMPDDTQIVVLSGVKAYGKTNCVEMTGPLHQDTNIYSYMKNGDFYLLNTGRGATWDKLPFGLAPGKVYSTEPVRDTGTSLGHHYDIMGHRDLYVDGYDTSSIAGKVYHCIRLKLVEVKAFEGVDYKNATTYWYAPELGYFVRANFGWGGKYFLNQQAVLYQPKKVSD